jgi:hypothetical protein
MAHWSRSLFLPFILLAAALLLSSCKVIPITPQTIRGKYTYEGQPNGMWNAGESIVLGEGTFEYSLYTADLVDHPQINRDPIRGRYKLDGSTITFLNPAVPYPERTLTRRHKLFVLWTPKQIDEFHSTGVRPNDLLYQQP